MKKTQHRPRLTKWEFNYIQQLKKEERVLVIPDLHEPFTLKHYIEFVKDVQSKYNTNKTVFLGDIIDNHYSSYHESCPDGFGAGKELELSISKIKKWHKAFPNAFVCDGNHDLLIARKAFTAGLSNRWVKTLKEVLETPTWEYRDSWTFNNVLYRHGIGRQAFTKAKNENISVVQGHYHGQTYIRTVQNYDNSIIFAFQLGCGINKDSYAMAYGKNFDDPKINCGVILNDGRTPIIETMF